MKRQPLVVGNWKMNLDHEQAASLARSVVAACAKDQGGEGRAAVVVAPPFTALQSVAAELAGSAVGLAAQNVSAEVGGAHTGEIAVPMLAALGVSSVILGHSERRQLYGERDAQIMRKLQTVLHGGLAVILCVGETLAERESGTAQTVVATQLEGALGAAADNDGSVLVSRLCLAYEPVWAIGTGRTATPEDAAVMHRSIRGWLQQRFGGAIAEGVRILYGGSVKPENAAALLGTREIDGVLVGAAAIDAGSFASIVTSARSSEVA